ncbi:3-oxoacyl-ACP synthase [Natranaerofaba carboxydovora]|uniref:3-oxoacyl-ACP synthase n=1 Tax=Natranaerofaba carboxydovora TaxID=2742683 RepID=UPI001F12EEDB|nr:3-oxoacyl-ACP synthase [Natranaerofaba carboxydovora]UMZ73463.1 3-oxoacyl-[acyl-carrier-protein] synthase 3 [Natranaerofaba carboxydovora]
MARDQVGIYNIGCYIPSNVQTSEEISKKSGISVEVLEEKYGIKKKPKAGENEHLSDMAIEASKNALVDFDPLELDMIIYCGTGYKDYKIWPLATKIQYELGALNAFSFEVNAFCVGGVMSLQLAKSMMLQQGLNNVLIVTAARELDLVDYNNRETSFLFNFSDGAVAALIRRGYSNNLVLESSVISDGSFSDNIKVKGGGSKHPLPKKDELNYFEVENFDHMKERLDTTSPHNFIKVIKESVAKSGYKPEEIDFLAPLHMKRSFHKKMLKNLNLSQSQSFYLENYGHLQAGDTFLVVKKAEEKNLIKSGDLIVMVSAGTGYTWGATTVKWDGLREK